MVFLELVTAHLLGDFVFQSNDLIQKKYKSWTGTLQHDFIISAFTILFLFPYWNHKEAWIVTAAVFVAHFIQDFIKVKYDINCNKNKSTLPFFIDQALHIGLLVFVSSLFNDLTPLQLPLWAKEMYFSQYLAIYLMGLLLFSYTYDITLFQFKRQKSKKPIQYKPNFPGMRKRLLFFSVVYVLVMIVSRSGM